MSIYPAAIWSQQKQLDLALQSGISLPAGNYRSHNLTEGAFTLPGFYTGIESTLFFSRNIGVVIGSGINLHPVDVVALSEAKTVSDPFMTSVVIRSEPYQMITLTAGPVIKVPVSGRFSIIGFGQGGIMWGKTPHQLYKPQYFITGPDFFEITSSRDKSFMLSSGIDIQYRLSSCLKLKLAGTCNYAKMSFGFYGASGYRVDIKQVLFFNILAGVVIPLI
ncbi:MAG: hypothetical protein GXO83_02840 [Chlorobi bacterium]|nr:hypothetical protein [Chlorobiota bacterium]